MPSSANIDWIVRENNPYDDGYWARFDGAPRPTGKRQRKGWDDCNRELAAETEHAFTNNKRGAGDSDG